MSSDRGTEEGAAAPEGSASAQQLDDAIDALRNTLTEEPVPDTWRRDIAVIGVLVALFGMVAWYAALSDRSPSAIAQLEVVGTMNDEDSWLVVGFKQVFSSYVQAGDRLRLRHADTLRANAGVSPVPMVNIGRTTAEPTWHIRVELSDHPASNVLYARMTLIPLDDESQARTVVLSGDVRAVSDVAARVALQVFDWLEIDPFSAAESREVVADIPSSVDVVEPYALGLEALRQGEGRKALEHLLAAKQIEPDHPMLNAALAEAYDFLGYREKAIEAIGAAYELRGTLSREKQLSIEARQKLLRHEWQEAEDLYSALTAFHPEEITYGLALAEAQYMGSRQKQALATLSDLRRQTDFSGDPRIDLAEARLWRTVGDWRKGFQAADRAAMLAEQQGFVGVLAHALITYATLEGPDKDSALQRAGELFQSIDDPLGTSQVLREMGDGHKAAGRLAQAAEHYEQSLSLSEAVGNEAEVSAARRARAIVHDLNGELESGYALKLEVLDSYQRRAMHADAAIMLENVGISLFKMGRLNEAEARYAEALAEFREHGDVIGIAWWPYHQGRLLVRRGDLEQARMLFDRALINAESHPEGYLELHTQFELAQLSLFERLPGGAEKLAHVAERYEQAQLYLDLGATLVLQARHARLQGDDVGASRYLERATSIFATSKADYYLAIARTHQVRLGNLDICEPLHEQITNFQHREVALLAWAALLRCDELEVDVDQLLAESTSLGLFESTVAFTAVEHPEDARRLARERGWKILEHQVP